MSVCYFQFWKPSDVLKTETEERFDDTKKTFTDKWSRETFVKKNAAKKTTKKADDDDDFECVTRFARLSVLLAACLRCLCNTLKEMKKQYTFFYL